MKRTLQLITSIIIIGSCAHHRSVHESMKYPSYLEKAYQEAAETPNLRSFLVSKNNQLVAEAYFDKYTGDSLDHVRSVTKSVMAILIGIAIEQEFISSVDASIGTYLKDLPDEKKDITVKHLLTMTSGISWNEGANAEGYGAWASSPNELAYILKKPMATTPGTVWNYCSGCLHILSPLLTRASGMNTLRFAKKYLFEPLGIQQVRWEKNADGYYNGAAGLELKPRDMIKIGQLFANGGLHEGTRIISERYVGEATSHQQPPDMNLGKDQGYGYSWWLGGDEGIHIYAALGYGGQIIAVARDANIVIVLTHNWRGINGTIAAQQNKRGINTLTAEALKAMIKP